MSAFAYSIFGFVVAIGILVTVHEYGHFWVARKFGVKVLKFSIGFGRPIFSWRRAGDPTVYSIGAIPLGGYVKMLDEREGEVRAEEREQAFNRKSLAARSAIAAAGPAANFLFAVVAVWLVFVVGGDDMRAEVGAVAPESPAARAGFRAGDLVVGVNGRDNRTWGQHQIYLLHQAMRGAAVEFTVERAGRRLDLSADLGEINSYEIGRRDIIAQIGLRPPAPPAAVWRFAEDSPARAAGLQIGDRIIAVDATPIANWYELVAAVSARPNETMRLQIRRGGELITVELTTAAAAVGDRAIGRVGLYRPPLDAARLRYGIWEAVPAAAEYTWHMSVVTLRAVGRMLSARMSVENLSGPVTIARIAGYTAETGAVDFIKFLAIVSVSLGLLNIMPIPLLDGGHLLYFAIEAVRGRPLSERAQLIGQRIGIIMLALLMGLAFYNDILRWFVR